MRTRRRRTAGADGDSPPSPWLVPPIEGAAVEVPTPHEPLVTPEEQRIGASRPATCTPATRRRPGGRYLFTWLSAHGGAGGTSLAVASGRGADLCREWPDPNLGWPPAVALVARSNTAGLAAAAELIREVASGRVSGLRIVAMIVVADAPARTTKGVRRTVHELSSTVPTVLEVPWIHSWRDQPYTPQPAVNQVAAQVAALSTKEK